MKRTAAILVLAGASAAHANPASVVASAADPGDPADLNVSVDYAFSLDRALLLREQVGGDVDPDAPLPRFRDLAFRQARHTLTPRAEVGVYHDTWLTLALPIIISQSRELQLADGVTRETSPTLAGGLLPPAGFDARDPSVAPTGDLVFRGVSRSGLDQIHVGLGVAPMNQDRDPSKPTWKLAAELRLAVGKVMRFDANDPTRQNGVGRGTHELRLSTSVAKRYARTEGWFELFWQVPLTSTDASLFDDPGLGATNTNLPRQGGAAFGGEIYLHDDVATGNRISLDLGGRMTAKFEGRDYSEMWEVFAYAGSNYGPLTLDADPVAPELQSRNHPGVTNIENHLELAGRAAVRGKLGSNVRFAATLDVVWKSDHVITFADAGIDLPSCGSPPCENDDNGVVNPGTQEVNPFHVPRLDLVGHRYHVEEYLGLVFGLEGQILF